MAQKLSRVTRDIWALSLATFINRATGFLGLFAAVFFNEIKLDAQAVVLALLIVGIAGVSGSLVGGHLADRIGKLPVLLGSTLINIVIFTALALADYTLGWWTVTLAALNVFVSQSFVGPASALVAASAAGRERVSRFAFYRIFINVGSIVAPALVGIIGREHFNLLFWFSVAGSALVPFILYWGIRGAATSNASSTSEPSDPHENASVVDNSQNKPGARRHPGMWGTLALPFVYIAMAFTMVVYAQHQSAVPLRLDSEPNGVQLYSFLLIINPVIVIFFEYPLSHLTKRLPSYLALSLGIFVMGFGVALTGICASLPAIVIAGWVLFSVGECLFAPMSHTYVAELASEAAQSRSQSYLATVQSIGYALGPGIGSWMLLVLAAGAWGGFMILTLAAVGMVLCARLGEPRESGADHADERDKS
jgi:MFS transporter